MTASGRATAPVPQHLVRRRPNYDPRPTLPAGGAGDCIAGWPAIGARLRATGARRIAVEAYPGVRAADLAALADATGADLLVDAASALKPSRDIDSLVHSDLGDDPVFG